MGRWWSEYGGPAPHFFSPWVSYQTPLKCQNDWGAGGGKKKKWKKGGNFFFAIRKVKKFLQLFFFFSFFLLPSFLRFGKVLGEKIFYPPPLPKNPWPKKKFWPAPFFFKKRGIFAPFFPPGFCSRKMSNIKSIFARLSLFFCIFV